VFKVDLAKDYDLSRGGDYTVSFESRLDGTRTANGRKVTGADGRMAGLRSAPVLLWVDGDQRAQAAARRTPQGYGKPGGGGRSADGVTYVGCSATQQTGGGRRWPGARLFREAKNYVNRQRRTPRYTTWFGARHATRFNTIKSHFASIDTALDQTGGRSRSTAAATRTTTPTSTRPSRTRSSSARRSGRRRPPARTPRAAR
jgi:peptidyl-Lys metalloendopeptidase